MERLTRVVGPLATNCHILADPRWKEFLAKVQPLFHTQQNRILVPTSFSPLR